MNPPDGEAPAPDWQLEFSDLDSGAPSQPPAAAAAPGSSRSPRVRARRGAVTASALVLAVALLFAGIPDARAGLGRLAAGLSPRPTPSLATGEGVFYFAPNPPGTDILVDGKVLAVPPGPGSVHPLVLARGPHRLAWRSHLFPFTPISCTLTVPAAVGDSCELVDRTLLAQERISVQGNVLAARLSHDTLPPATARQLDNEIQGAIGSVAATASLVAGDHYYYCPQGLDCRVATAAGPLTAQLGYQVITDRGYPEPCVLGDGIPCRFAGQDCGQLCTVAVTPAAIAGAGADAARVWTAALTVQAEWRFTSADGQLMLDNIPEMFGAQLMVLRITWERDGWHVTPVFGHIPGLDVVDDVVCDPLRVWLAQTTWSFMLLDPPPDASVRFTSTADPAFGCLAALGQTGTKPAYFLQHAGTPLLMNDVGYNPQDNLARASPHEQALAVPLFLALTP
jgi:hypothetical protein